MILVAILLLPAVAGTLAWMAERRSGFGAARWLCASALIADLLVLIPLFPRASSQGLMQIDAPWIPALGIRFHLMLDGFGLVMVLLTLLLGLVALVATGREKDERNSAFLFHIMASITGIIGVFTASDLFLFFVFYEVMLVPIYFLISLWDREGRGAATKFFIFTQAGGMLMLLSIVGLYLYVNHATGHQTFDLTELLRHDTAAPFAMLLLLGFVIAFAVKLPSVPFHSWQPDAYAAAPAAAAIILAGLMSKAGAYGLLRFAIPLFPEAAHNIAFWAMLVGVISILYGAVMAFAQRDLRRVIAYSSMSHLGFVLLGAFAMNAIAFKGVIMTMVCHGISVSGLFLLDQAVRERRESDDLDRMGGLWKTAPKLGATGLVFVLATLGIPGLGNFVGEFLVLLGAYQANPILAAVAAIGMVLSAVYALWMMQRIFFGPTGATAETSDVTPGYLAIVIPMIVALLTLGLYPQPVLRAAGGWRMSTPPAMTKHTLGVSNVDHEEPAVPNAADSETAR